MFGPPSVNTIFWNMHSTFDRKHGAVFHRDLTDLGVRTSNVLYANTASGESAIAVTADSPHKIELARSLLERLDVEVNELGSMTEVATPSRTLFDAIHAIPAAARENFGHREQIDVNAHLDSLLHAILIGAHVIYIPDGGSEERLLERARESGLYVNHWDTQIQDRRRWSIVLAAGEGSDQFSRITQSVGITSHPTWASGCLWRALTDDAHRVARRALGRFGFPSQHIEDAVQEVLQDLYWHLQRDASNPGQIDESVLAKYLRCWLGRVRSRLLDDRRTTARRRDLLLNQSPELTDHVELPDLLALSEARQVIGIVTTEWAQSLSPDVRDRVRRRVSGETPETIAQARNEPVGTTKASLSRALGVLKTSLHKNVGGEVLSTKDLWEVLEDLPDNTDSMQPPGTS